MKENKREERLAEKATGFGIACESCHCKEWYIVITECPDCGDTAIHSVCAECQHVKHISDSAQFFLDSHQGGIELEEAEDETKGQTIQ